MRKDQVPQDDGKMLDGKTRDLYYVLDEHGNYVQALSQGWDPKTAVLQQAWEDINEHVEQAKADVRAGKYSPLHYHMQKAQMDLKLLSEYSGFSKGKIKDHLNPAGFAALTETERNTYAEALGIVPESLDSVD
jgi:hypothetical protein